MGSVNQKRQSPCGVSEDAFPQLDLCCYEGAQPLGGSYESLCPHCRSWTSLPNGDSLTVAHIIECKLYGFVTRLKK